MPGGQPGAQTRGRHGLLQLRRAGEWPVSPSLFGPAALRRRALSRSPTAPLPARRLYFLRPRLCPAVAVLWLRSLLSPPQPRSLAAVPPSPCAPGSAASLGPSTALLSPTTEPRFPVALHPPGCTCGAVLPWLRLSRVPVCDGWEPIAFPARFTLLHQQLCPPPTATTLLSPAVALLFRGWVQSPHIPSPQAFMHMNGAPFFSLCSRAFPARVCAPPCLPPAALLLTMLRTSTLCVLFCVILLLWIVFTLPLLPQPSFGYAICGVPCFTSPLRLQLQTSSSPLPSS